VLSAATRRMRRLQASYLLSSASLLGRDQVHRPVCHNRTRPSRLIKLGSFCKKSALPMRIPHGAALSKLLHPVLDFGKIARGVSLESSQAPDVYVSFRTVAAKSKPSISLRVVESPLLAAIWHRRISKRYSSADGSVDMGAR
jgi:hypothetical protein